MKKIILIIIILVSTYTSHSQIYKNSYRFGANLVNLEDDKFAVDFYYNQYSRRIAKRVEVGLGLGLISYAHDDGRKEMLSDLWWGPLPAGVEDVVISPGNSTYSSQWLLNANISYAPIQHGRFQLKIGGGFSMTHYSGGYTNNFEYAAWLSTTGQFHYSKVTINEYEHAVSFAYNFFVEPEYSINSRFFVSARVSPYFFFDNLAPYIYSAGLTAGIRF
jgi:hypothetical protein